MTKAKISEYDAVASNNTDVNGVNIAENCPPSGMNNMGREIMAALKRFQTGSDGDGVTVGGNLVVSGSSTLATTAISSADINGGTIDGTVIGGASAAAGAFTTLNTSGAVVFNDAGANVDFRVEGDTEANLLFVDASADKVGIGTSSPGTVLNVVGTTGIRVRGANSSSDGALDLRADNTSCTINAATFGSSVPLVFQTDGSERMRIDSSGNLGIGATSPTTKLDVFQDQNAASNLRIRNNDSGSSAYAGVIVNASGNSWGMRMGSSAANSNALQFVLDALGTPSVKATIDSSGNLLVGWTLANPGKVSILGNSSTSSMLNLVNQSSPTTEASVKFATTQAASASAVALAIQFGDGSAVTSNSLFIRTNGDVENTNDSYGPIASDQRLKQDIVDAGSQWDDLKNLRIRKFHYRNDPDGHLQIGCIAQEAEQVSPGLVKRRPVTKEDVLVNPELGTLVDDLKKPIKDEEGNITGYEQKVETDTEVLSFKSSILFWKATKALQEAIERIETLEAKVAALENA
jgi:hypothetical protein